MLGGTNSLGSPKHILASAGDRIMHDGALFS